MHRDNVKDLLVLAMITSIIVLLSNPDIMDVIAENTVESIVIVLRWLDSLAVKYQLMRGNFYGSPEGHESKGAEKD